MNKHKNFGFTIVELLVVISIIGILAAITTNSFSGVLAKARDTKRISEITAVAKALDLQYIANGKYPNVVATGVGGNLTCLSVTNWYCWGFTDSTRFIEKSYLPVMPQDPSVVDDNACAYPNSGRTRAYWYEVTSDNQGYVVGTRLEKPNTSDPRYRNGTKNYGCGNFINYAIERNFP